MKSAVYLILMTILLIFLGLFARDKVIPVLSNPLLAFGLVAMGAFLSALVRGKAGLTVPKYPSTFAQSAVGGILMGAGFAMAGLPKLATDLNMIFGVFYWLSLLMPLGFIYLAGILIGGGTAAAMQKQFYPRITFTAFDGKTQKNIAKFSRYLLMGLALLILALTAKTTWTANAQLLNLTGAALALAAGFLLERNRVCMGLLMKEIFFSKTWETLIKFAIVLVCLFAAWRYLGITGTGDGLPANYVLCLAGSFLMGFGFIIADGCYMGSLWKTGQGSLASLMALIGIFIGAGAARAVPTFSVSIGVFSSTGPINNTWETVGIKIGLAILIFIWTGSLLLEKPLPVMKRGPVKVWLLSEAALVITVLTMISKRGWNIPVPLQIGGLALYYAGIALYCWARIVLGKYWGEAIVLREGHQIIKTGPYSYLKHPIYVSVVLILTGLSLVMKSAAGLAGVYVLVLPTLILRAREETRLLRQI